VLVGTVMVVAGSMLADTLLERLDPRVAHDEIMAARSAA